jgi:hypothetical protein
MFVAKDMQTGLRVTSIAAEWLGRPEELRALADADRLACPGCEQRVRFRRPQFYRQHFAHRHLLDCPLARQSAEVLEAKAQLYDWLSSKYPRAVELDVDLQLPGCTLVADLTVRPGPGPVFAYWVFDRQQREREALADLVSRRNSRYHVIHTQSTYRRREDGLLELTASQRDFVGSSQYDRPLNWEAHLYFLDSERGALRICRGLLCIHRPNLYEVERDRTGLLTAALIRPKTGELLFPEDVAELETWEAEQAAERARREVAEKERRAREAALAEARARERAEAQARREAQQRARAAEQQAREAQRAAERARRWAEMQAAATAATDRPAAPPEPPAYAALNQPLRCEDCGTLTTRWSVAHPGRGTCVCRDCLRKRHQHQTEGRS